MHDRSAHLHANTKAERYHLSVGALIRDHHGRVVVLERPCGTCVLITGTLEPGETLRGALHREIGEEAGVTARPSRFVGATEMPFTWGGERDEKTILWHEMHLLAQDDALRADEDPEAAARVVWLTPRAARRIFSDQGMTLGDWDYSSAIARLDAPGEPGA